MRYLATLVALAVLTLPGVAAAHDEQLPTTAHLSDPAGDVANPRGDATRARLVNTPDRVAVALKVVTFSPPGHPGWASDDSAARWFLDTRDDGSADFKVVVSGRAGELIGKVVRLSDGDRRCVGPARLDPDRRTYAYAFAPRCIGTPQRARFHAEMAWDRAPDDPDRGAQVDAVHGPYQGYSSWTFAVEDAH